jgi:IS5 family transposase
MLGKKEKNPQLTISQTPLIHFIDPGHDLCRLAKQVNWDQVEKDFAVFYSNKGAPSVPMRSMAGLSVLKQVYRCSDKSALVHWVENPYWQHFCGEVYFQHKAPFYVGDFGHFRKRIGKSGERMITQLGTDIFGSVYARGIPLSEKKVKTRPGNRGFNRTLNRLGNYLIKLSAH